MNTIEFAFGHVRHHRHALASHGFAYRAFYLRVPIHDLARLSITTPWFGFNRPGLIGFKQSDHGDGKTPLTDWIRNTLAQHHLQADGEIWLHCFARVLGYQFKPVSFWFCHAKNGALVAVLAEVNNTFGEKHLYLLSDDQPLKYGQTLHAKKAFHVSPFFEVKGDYAFRFFNQSQRSVARIDYYLNGAIALNTSMSGRHVPVSTSSTIRALFTYPLFSAAVVARIHWHAVQLWVRRKVPYISKPAPPEHLVTKGQP